MTAINWYIGIFVSLLGTAFALESFYAKRQTRLGHLICKYNDYEAARRAFRGEIWPGQTEMQLLDSRGEPARRNRLQASAGREEWIYRARGFGCNSLQVTLENGIVTGWDQTAVGPARKRALESGPIRPERIQITALHE